MRRRSARIAATIGASLVALVAGVAAPAAACACGAYVSTGDTSVSRERAAIKWDGTTEDLVISLDVLGSSPHAGFLVPVPAQAEVALEDVALFDELDERTQPREEKVTNWWPNLTFLEMLGIGDEEDTAGAEEPVEVLEQQQLGPLTVAQLAANDPVALATWLTTNGYAVDPSIATAAQPYAEAGWVMVAIKITPVEVDTVLDSGTIQPIKLRFPSVEPVYPMRLSRLADEPITVELYVLAPNRMDSEFAAVPGEAPEVGYAGLLDPANIGPVSRVGQWLTEPTYLTRFDQVITDPSQIAGDYTFTPAAEDEPFQTVIFVDRDLGWLTGGLIALLVITLLAVVPTRIAYKRRIRAERRAASTIQPV